MAGDVVGIERWQDHHKKIEKQELYEKYLEDRNKFSSNIKIAKSSKDAITDKTTRLENYDKKYTQYR